MAYTITDLAELIRYHLVLGESDDDRADRNLALLVNEIRAMATRPLLGEPRWASCERCGSLVDTALIHPDGHHFDADGDFYCADCWADRTR